MVERGQRHFKMANFRAGKLAREKNGRFQSTTVKSKTGNYLNSRKTKSRVIALMMLKCHFSPRVKVKPRLGETWGVYHLQKISGNFG